MNVGAVPGIVDTFRLLTLVPYRVAEEGINTSERMEFSDNMLSDKIHDAEPITVESAASLVRVLTTMLKSPCLYVNSDAKKFKNESLSSLFSETKFIAAVAFSMSQFGPS